MDMAFLGFKMLVDAIARKLLFEAAATVLATPRGCDPDGTARVDFTVVGDGAVGGQSKGGAIPRLEAGGAAAVLLVNTTGAHHR